jgi:HAD superfamily hydrolase (TIGR01509 family)
MRAVCFDLDGLMFNTEEVYWQVGTEVLRRRGCEFTAELNDAVMGSPPKACFETMIRWHSLPDRWQDLQAESEGLFLSLLESNLLPMPGLIELLDALEAAGMPKAICTSSRRDVVRSILSRFAMEPRFEFILTAEDIVEGKPNPEIYLKAAGRFGVEPGEMLVLEDSQNGCRAAVAAGSFTVAVPGCHSREQDFRTASLVIQSLSDPRLYDALGIEAGREK